MEEQLTVDEAREKFLSDLEVLCRASNFSLFKKYIIVPLLNYTSTHRNFFMVDPEERKKFLVQAISQMQGKTADYDPCIKIAMEYYETPFGIFDTVLKVKASDIFIVPNRISFSISNAEEAQNIEIPPQCTAVYDYLVDAFIKMALYSSEHATTKFDKADPVLDYSTFGVRFNAVHSSLSAAADPKSIVTLRKQIINTNNSFDTEKYVSSVGASKTQIEFLNNIANNGSYVCFGETGSGKTTLLKYLGNYNIKEKRNLITIEDTKELFLPVNIAYLTNNRYTISDLFKITLRENPSHVIIGETRGAEIVDILQAGLVFRVGTSIHADSLQKAVTRIIMMTKGDKNNEYSSDDINELVTATVDCFIYMKDRKIKEIWRRKPIGELTKNNAIANYELVE